MADRPPALVPIDGIPFDAAMQQPHWRKEWRLSSVGDRLESFLAVSGFDRGPWLAVAFAGGIAAWFALGTKAGWLAALGTAIALAAVSAAIWRNRPDRTHLRTAGIALGLLVASGLGLVWAKSELAGARPIASPVVATIQARVLERIEEPADNRVRLVLATRDLEHNRPLRVRVNLPLAKDKPGLGEGAVVRLKVRLMPPAAPLLPGSYDFARAAWFQGFSATGSVLGDAQILAPGERASGFAPLKRDLSAHIRKQLSGSPGAIAAAFASGDRGAIAQADEDAMRDAGLTHLLSISGLHVSAVIAASYLLAIKLLALWPWLALRVRLPIVAAAFAALAGLGYTLLTGAEVPTIRSCVGAVLVLIAMALGREPLSLRMVAVAAFVVLLMWPESLSGPSFQMSFAAVISIVALHNCRPVRDFLAPREEGWLAWSAKRMLMLLVTGFVIELALMPIVLFHFHRAGMLGAFANVIAIPLTTFVSMPLIALALLLDLVGLGAPIWWLAGKSLELLLGVAHWAAAQPGAVKLMPQMGWTTFALFIAGGLWLALWRGKVRLWSIVPIACATALLLQTRAPDLLVTGDGRNVAISGEAQRLLLLRDSGSSFSRDNLLELAGASENTGPLAGYPGAKCNSEFCSITLRRSNRDWRILLSRSRDLVPERELAAACDRADIVVADRYLPRSCKPLWLKADRNMLAHTGGLAVDLEHRNYDSVAKAQGEHGWWQERETR